MPSRNLTAEESTAEARIQGEDQKGGGHAEHQDAQGAEAFDDLAELAATRGQDKQIKEHSFSGRTLQQNRTDNRERSRLHAP